jgi:UDP-N-acetylglucosamine--N-acetylmuramyl-(pentapeptide) pyrophosphoryl-undecaprenol N-acetylglucosamine transferase
VAQSAAPLPPNADHSPVEWRYIGERGGIEEGLAGRAGLPFNVVETGQIRGQAPWKMARNLMRILAGARQCAAVMAEFRPDVAFITGGYVTAPVALAARQCGVPLLIYLPDLTPGLAIRLTARLAATVAVSFPEVAGYFGAKAVVTGYPVRQELLETSKPAGRQALGLAADVPVVMALGGSRGAASINRALVAALDQLLPRCQIIHISGEHDWASVAGVRDTLPPALAERYHAYPYLHEEMAAALAAADLVIARAGAATLGEFPALGLPSILVPYPYAGQHQQANAEYLADRGAALILRDSDLAAQLAPTVLQLLGNTGTLTGMAQAATVLARPHAAAQLAAELAHLAKAK